MAKQVIGIGSTANDGTGDPIRTAMDKVNDNFTELYADKLFAKEGPVIGNAKYADIQKAIQFVDITGAVAGDLFYFSEICAGTDVGSGNTRYRVKVAKTTSLGSAGADVAQYTLDAAASARTGCELLDLAELSSSGITGHVVINWDYTDSVSAYVAALWTELGFTFIPY